MSIEGDTSNLRAAKQHSQKKNDERAKPIRTPTKRNRISKKHTIEDKT